jgi:hypothetical protein
MVPTAYWDLWTAHILIGKLSQGPARFIQGQGREGVDCDGGNFRWHASYGYAGTLNDISILSLPPLLDRMVDGSLHTLETDSGCVPFRIGDEEFSLLFLLVDGIYSHCSRFVRGMKEPITEKERKYIGRQEVC